MMEEDDTIAHRLENDSTNPGTAYTENDYRVNCTDSQSLRSILDITLEQFSEFANSSNLKHPSEFISHFSDTFKNSLQENIIVNGLPLRLDKSCTIRTPEKEEQKQVFDEALFSKLSKTVSAVAHKRKFCPEQCCRILNMQMKHDIQNLKKTKVLSSGPSTSSVPPISPEDIAKSRKDVEKFSDFCKNFNSVKETVQCKLREREKIAFKINIATEIQKQEHHLTSAASDADIA